MYQILMQKDNQPVDTMQHRFCAEDISNVEMTLTALVSNRLGIKHLVLMPVGEHSYMAFQVLNLHTLVTVNKVKATSEGA